MYFLYSLILLNFFSLCDPVEKGWKNIKPFSADKSSVDKLLGDPKIDDNGYFGYSTDEAFIQVNYSTAPCTENQYGRGKYDVPEGTVLRYWVNLRKPLKLSEVKFERQNYERDTSGHGKDNVTYISRELGVIIDVGIQEGVEYIGKIEYRPGSNEEDKHKCKK